MRVARRIVAALSIVILSPIVALSEVKTDSHLRLASDVWPPFTDVEGKPRRSIELVKAALDIDKVASTTTITTWDVAIAGMKNGTFDGSAAVWRTSEREAFLLFSKPYLENRLVLVARAGVPVDKLRFSDLKGKRLALVEGYGYGDIIDQASGAVLIYAKNDAANLEAILAGTADYMLADELLVHRLFEDYPEKSRQLLVASSSPLATRSLHFAVRKNLPNAQSLIDGFNTNIKTLVANGTYNRILEVAWIRADLDESGVEHFVGTGAAPDRAPDAKTAYRLFLSNTSEEGTNGSPTYMVDGKRYKDWDEASHRLRSGVAKERSKSARHDDVGLVLLRF